MNPTPLDQLSFDSWKECVHTQFRVEVSPARAVIMELIEAVFTGESAKDKSSGPRYQSFSLTFCSDTTNSLTQRTYRFQHDKIGSFDLFIVPIAAVAGTVHYEAVFNRLLSAK